MSKYFILEIWMFYRKEGEREKGFLRDTKQQLVTLYINIFICYFSNKYI